MFQNYMYVLRIFLFESAILFYIVPVRLVDESGNTRAVFTGGVQDISRGRVEVLMNREWRTVCSQGFGLKEANVICNQLGLNGARRVRTGYYGDGSGQIVALQNRGCCGGEGNILDCDLSPAHDCLHANDVGIECIGMNINMLKHCYECCI